MKVQTRATRSKTRVSNKENETLAISKTRTPKSKLKASSKVLAELKNNSMNEVSPIEGNNEKNGKMNPSIKNLPKSNKVSGESKSKSINEVSLNENKIVENSIKRSLRNRQEPKNKSQNDISLNDSKLAGSNSKRSLRNSPNKVLGESKNNNSLNKSLSKEGKNLSPIEKRSSLKKVVEKKNDSLNETNTEHLGKRNLRNLSKLSSLQSKKKLEPETSLNKSSSGKEKSNIKKPIWEKLNNSTKDLEGENVYDFVFDPSKEVNKLKRKVRTRNTKPRTKRNITAKKTNQMTSINKPVLRVAAAKVKEREKIVVNLSNQEVNVNENSRINVIVDEKENNLQLMENDIIDNIDMGVSSHFQDNLTRYEDNSTRLLSNAELVLENNFGFDEDEEDDSPPPIVKKVEDDPPIHHVFARMQVEVNDNIVMELSSHSPILAGDFNEEMACNESEIPAHKEDREMVLENNFGFEESVNEESPVKAAPHHIVESTPLKLTKNVAPAAPCFFTSPVRRVPFQLDNHKTHGPARLQNHSTTARAVASTSKVTTHSLIQLVSDSNEDVPFMSVEDETQETVCHQLMSPPPVIPPSSFKTIPRRSYSKRRAATVKKHALEDDESNHEEAVPSKRRVKPQKKNKYDLEAEQWAKQMACHFDEIDQFNLSC